MDARREQEFERLRTPAGPAGGERARSSEPEQIASSLGNHVFRSVLARDGAGIMPDGTAHPEVQSGIQSARGGGAALDAGRARPHRARRSATTCPTSACTPTSAPTTWRARSRRAPSPRAPTSSSPAASTSPGSSSGEELLTHELAHVVQQRGAPTSGPLQVSQPGDALEQDADRAAANARG